MNRIGDIIKEINEANATISQYNEAVKDLVAKTMVLYEEWRGLCSHPNEYYDEEENKCTACGFIFPEREYYEDE